MKEKIATIIIFLILAFFVGLVFMRGNSVINGTAANDFKLFAFSNNDNIVSVDNYAALETFIDTRKSDIKKATITFYIDNEVLDKLELSLQEGVITIKPSKKVLSILHNNDQTYKYTVYLTWDNKNSEKIEKTIITN